VLAVAQGQHDPRARPTGDAPAVQRHLRRIEVERLVLGTPAPEDEAGIGPRHRESLELERHFQIAT